MTIDRGEGQVGIVVRSFDDALDAEAAFRALHDAGFSSVDISIVVNDPGRAQVGTGDTGAGVVEDPGTIMSPEHQGPDGISVGTTGLVIPGVGIVIGGPLALAFAEDDGSGAPADLAEALIRLGVPQKEASSYREQHHAGKIIVLIAARERLQEARDTLENEANWSYRDELRPIDPTETTPTSGS